MNNIEVCFSPAMYPYKTTTDNFIVVIVDVLRATSSFCAALDSGVEAIIPVSGLDELREYKKSGYLTAAERDGKKVDFVDFGNSPTVFLQQNLHGKKLAYSTTNGMQAIETAKHSESIVIAAFSNLSAVCNWLTTQQKNIIILCSGWKNTFSLEDTLCAGAIVEALKLTGMFLNCCDSSEASLELWETSKNQLAEVVKNANHYKRLETLGQNADLEYCFRLNTSNAVPVWDGKGFVNKLHKVK